MPCPTPSCRHSCSTTPLMVSDNNAFDILCRHFLSPRKSTARCEAEAWPPTSTSLHRGPDARRQYRRRSLNTATALDATKLMYPLLHGRHHGIVDSHQGHHGPRVAVRSEPYTGRHPRQQRQDIP